MFDHSRALTVLTVEVSDDAARLDAIRALEELKCAAAARQAELTAELDAGRPDAEIAADVAAARRESPHHGRQHLGLARILHSEMPETMASFTAGRITEWKATLLVRESACLSLKDRRAIDLALASSAESMGDRELERAARNLACSLDPRAAVERRRNAEADRGVTLRPAPDTMTYLTALVPVEQGVAAYAALVRAADTDRSSGGARGRGQVMADTLIERITGQATAADVPVTVNLVVSDQVLLGCGTESPTLEGGEPIPAGLARQWVTRASRRHLRRLYASPATGQLVAMDNRTRRFPAGLAQLIRFRDQTCRTPWCDAPIRHIDHIMAVAAGGETSYVNGQGLCEACNQAKGSSPPRHRHRPGAPPGPRPDVLHTRAEQVLLSYALAA